MLGKRFHQEKLEPLLDQIKYENSFAAAKRTFWVKIYFRQRPQIKIANWFKAS